MGEELRTSYDVVVVGAGNAAWCAALSARETGATVVVLERAPESERGGNTAFTAGAMRVIYDGLDDIVELVPDLTDDEKETTDFGSYTQEQFFDDMARGVDPERFIRTVTEYNAAIDQSVPFNPNIKDGRHIRRLNVPKSNWANTIDEPPFEAYAITKPTRLPAVSPSHSVGCGPTPTRT
jgi:2-polyprenyl-6-methoxyphenol hydroxylase-like FAD-dependent oxidoreductase